MIESSYTYGSKDAPKQLIILLHGVGSNGQDLIALSPHIATKLQNSLFVSPDAPFPCDMVPAGYPNSYQWFSLQDRDPDKILKGLQSVTPLVHDFIDEQLETYNVAPENCALLGFSQGTMTSLYAAPRYKHKLGAVLGYSGALYLGNPDEIKHKPPVYLIHGESDDVVPVQAHPIATKLLKDNEFNVGGYTQPILTHSIDETGIQKGAEFLRNNLTHI